MKENQKKSLKKWLKEEFKNTYKEVCLVEQLWVRNADLYYN